MLQEIVTGGLLDAGWIKGCVHKPISATNHITIRCEGTGDTCHEHNVHVYRLARLLSFIHTCTHTHTSEHTLLTIMKHTIYNITLYAFLEHETDSKGLWLKGIICTVLTLMT